MRLLIVCMPDGIHAARWLSALSDTGWDIHLFPVFFDPAVLNAANPLIDGVTYWDYTGLTPARPGRDVLVRSPLTAAERLVQDLFAYQPDTANLLERLIRRIRPDIVHSLEFQHAGYTTFAALQRLPPHERPTWIVSNYGSDISLFGRLEEHQDRLRSLMLNADVHVCECGRDLDLGRTFGFAGWEAPLIPVGGGWDLDAAAVYRNSGPTSQRRTIALKAYEGWAGRAGVALEALRRCGNLLAGYTLELYLASDEFAQRACRLTAGTGLRVEHVGGRAGWVPYEQMLALHGRARLSIGLSISDGISTSLLEAMMMGSFPIQSFTACADEWIEDGLSGILVHPEDPQPIAEAISRALRDDALVDTAAAINSQVVGDRLPYARVRDTIVSMYRQALHI